MGGPHATLLPYEVAQHVDGVVVGEAEMVWSKVLHDLVCDVRILSDSTPLTCTPGQLSRRCLTVPKSIAVQLRPAWPGCPVRGAI